MDDLESIRSQIAQIGAEAGWAFIGRVTGLHEDAISKFAAGKTSRPREESLDLLREFLSKVLRNGEPIGTDSVRLKSKTVTRGRRTNRFTSEQSRAFSAYKSDGEQFWLFETKAFNWMREELTLHEVNLSIEDRLRAYAEFVARMALLARLSHHWYSSYGRITDEMSEVLDKFQQACALNGAAFALGLQPDGVRRRIDPTSADSIARDLGVAPIEDTSVVRSNDGSANLCDRYGRSLAFFDPRILAQID